MSSQSSVLASAAQTYGETGAGARYGARMTDVLRRRIAAGLLIAGIAVAALASTDTGPFEPAPTEEGRVEAAVTVLLLSRMASGVSRIRLAAAHSVL